MKNDMLKKSRLVVLSLLMLIFAVGMIGYGLWITMGENDWVIPIEMLPEMKTGIIQSDSMFPTIKKGDFVCIKEEETYETGDIVMVRDEKIDWYCTVW